MFEIGNYVIYRNDGVCLVSDIRSESFGGTGQCEDYYILTPVGDMRSTLFIPVNNEKLTSLMKPLMNAEQINELIHRLSGQKLEWQNDARARNAHFKEIIISGDREQLILLLNTLNERFEEFSRNGKKQARQKWEYTLVPKSFFMMSFRQ